jgi:very-short-patch-repair endonuclease
MATPSGPARRRRLVAAEANKYGGVLSRPILRNLGVDHRAVAREVAAERWRMVGRQTVAIHLGPLPVEAHRWRAIWEIGPGGPALDGVTALQTLGLSGFDEDRLHVSVAHGWRPQKVEGVRLHHVARVEGEVVSAQGLPCVRAEVAALRAAHWARSDRQAALILCLVIQQQLTTGPRLVAASRTVRGRRRRKLVRLLVRDIADGAQSLGELDFSRMCREKGLPEPARQILRRGPAGRIYLDAGWPDLGLAVEVDGSQHRMALAVMDDNLRANEVVIGGETVLRIDLVGLRLEGPRFMDQVARALAHATQRRRRSL